MDEFIKRLCLRLAGSPAGDVPATAALSSGHATEHATEHASRRGFLRTIGKLTLGAAAVASGQALFARPAEAATALHCCEGIACRFHGCLHGMAIGYMWSCGGYFCHDCFTDYGNGNYYCTYTVARTTSPRRASARRAATRTYYAPPSYYSDSFYGPSEYGGD